MMGLLHVASLTLAALVFATTIPQTAGASSPASQGAHQATPLPVKSEAQAKAEGKPATNGGARTESKDGAASLQEVLSRISAAVAEQNGKVSAGPDAESHPPPARVRARIPKPAAATTKPQALLRWDPALTAGGVALSWDEQLNPRPTRSGDLGVRLAWPARIP
jgi:hypothetical protein